MNGKTVLVTGSTDGLQPAKAHAQAYDADARARLRKLSFELTGPAV